MMTLIYLCYHTDILSFMVIGFLLFEYFVTLEHFDAKQCFTSADQRLGTGTLGVK